MNTQPTATTWRESHQLLMPPYPNKDEQSRIGFFVDWLAATRRAWHTPDLPIYRDYLLHERVRINPSTGESRSAPLAPRTVQAHLSTIRGRYEALLRDNQFRQMLYSMAPENASAADRKAFVDEFIVRLQNAIHPSSTAIQTIIEQDKPDRQQLWLKPHHVNALLRAPGINTLPGLRDSAIIALLICTGIREEELVNLQVDDLRQKLDGEIALRIRAGKGYKQRLIPYGPLDWCLLYIDHWLAAAKIEHGAVFRGFYKGSKRVRRHAISTRAVNLILNQYLIMIDGELRDVKPHDLRRTYARNAYLSGMDLERIRQNLGHASLQTTQIYLGSLGADQRRPPAMFALPHGLEEFQRFWEEQQADGAPS